MKKILFISLLALAIIFLINTKSYAQQKTLYDFKVENVDGEVFDFSKLKGNKVLVVNVASKCGLTPQYEKLQELYDKYKEQDFEIIAFPANNFAEQEPGSNQEIKKVLLIKFQHYFSNNGEDIC